MSAHYYHLCITKNANLIHKDLCYSKIIFEYDYSVAAYFCVPVADTNLTVFAYLIRDIESEDLTVLKLSGAEIYKVPHIDAYGDVPDEFPVRFSYYFRPHPMTPQL